MEVEKEKAIVKRFLGRFFLPGSQDPKEEEVIIYEPILMDYVLQAARKAYSLSRHCDLELYFGTEKINAALVSMDELLSAVDELEADTLESDKRNGMVRLTLYAHPTNWILVNISLTNAEPSFLEGSDDWILPRNDGNDNNNSLILEIDPTWSRQYFEEAIKVKLNLLPTHNDTPITIFDSHGTQHVEAYTIRNGDFIEAFLDTERKPESNDQDIYFAPNPDGKAKQNARKVVQKPVALPKVGDIPEVLMPPVPPPEKKVPSPQKVLKPAPIPMPQEKAPPEAVVKAPVAAPKAVAPQSPAEKFPNHGNDMVLNLSPAQREIHSKLNDFGFAISPAHAVEIAKRHHTVEGAIDYYVGNENFQKKLAESNDDNGKGPAPQNLQDNFDSDRAAAAGIVSTIFCVI